MKTYGFDFPARRGWNRLRVSPAAGIRKLLRILADPHGLMRFINIVRVSARISREYSRYHAFMQGSLARQLPLMKARVEGLRYRPRISVLMPVFNVEEVWLRLAVESVRQQIYPDWELCIADDASTRPHVKPVLHEYAQLDPRIKVAHRATSGHISATLNTALELASHEFVTVLDHDDELAPDALYEVALLLQDHPEADLIYTDEDRLEADGTHVEPYFKPDWSPHLLLSINYITHLAVLRRRIVEAIGGFRDPFVGSQDYDMFLRFTEKSNRVFHIPKVLYSWRKIPGSAALLGDAKPYALDASVRALAEAAQRRGFGGAVVQGFYPPFLHFQHRIQGEPRTSLVVSFGVEESARRVVTSLRALTAGTEGAIEIIAMVSSALIGRVARRGDPAGCRLIPLPTENGPLCADLLEGAAAATGDYLAFVGPRLEPLGRRWLTAMIEYAQMPQIGCVGAKILDRRGKIIHAGLALGIRGTAGSPGRGLWDVPHLVFYLNLKDACREVSAVSAECLVISRARFLELGGFRREFQVGCFDVDLCLRLAQKGYSSLYTPRAVLRLTSQGTTSEARRSMLAQDRTFLREQWGDRLLTDPFYNPNLTRLGDDLGIASSVELLAH
jgi:glycosyltransferase involved in cell wall biosynthesis